MGEWAGHRRAVSQRSASAEVSAGLDLVALPACVIDPARRIRSRNTAFDRWTDDRPDMITGNRLSIGSPHFTRALARCCQGLSKRETLCLRPLSCAPIYLVMQRGGDANTITLFFLNLDAVNTERDALAARLQTLFGFSSAESLTATYLATGCSAADIAAERQVTVPTIRTQLAAIRIKLGVATTSHAVALISRLSVV